MMALFSLPWQLLLMLSLTAAVLVLLTFDKLRSDIIAMCILVILGLTGLLNPSQVFLGFASNAVISTIAIMMIGAGLEKTGLTGSVSSSILSLSHGKENRIGWILSITAGIFAGLLRSLGAFAFLLPVINRLSVYLHIPRSRLLMPVGFCAIVGGSLTLIGSSSLIVLNGIMNGGYSHIAIEPLSMFSVFPIGACILAAFVLFFHFFGGKVLPAISQESLSTGADISHFRRTYGFGGGFFEAQIRFSSPMKDLMLSEVEEILNEMQLAIVAVSNNREILMPPLRKTRFTQGGYIALLGSKESINDFAKRFDLQIHPTLHVFADILNPMRSGFSEIVIPPGSSLIGKEVRELHMRRNNGVQVLSIFRDNRESHGREMMDLTLRSGDTLGLFSEWHKLSQLEKKREFALVTSEYPREAYLPKKRYHALACVAMALFLVLFHGVDLGVGLMAGAIGMLITGVLEPEEAYHAVSWKTVFMLGGLVPFGLAMQTTGTAAWLAYHFLSWFGSWPQWSVLSLLAIIATVFGLLLSNVGAAIVLAPIAIHVAVAIHADPRLFAVVVALASSNSFLLPTHQVSALIAGPGGYKTQDFLRVGFWASLIYLVVMIPAAYLFM